MALQRWWARLPLSRRDRCFLLLLLLVALAFLSPALVDGPSFGGFDLVTTRTTLGAGLYSVVHSLANGDAVSQMVSWNALDWRLVHHGQFPLWNEYSALGMPAFHNFESGVLSLPDLVSYLVPLRFAFTVAVLVKLLLAGWGTYFAARTLACSELAALFAGGTFMLSGAFVNWVTWPLSDVVAWSGFLLGFAVLAWRDRRWRWVAALSISLAFSIYGGFPEANVLLAIAALALALGAVVPALGRATRASWRPCGRLALALVCGVALAAPLWLPGLKVIALSHRSHDTGYVGLPTRTLALLFTQGYEGLPTGSGAVFALPKWNYYETASYVGLLALVLAGVALVACWRRPVVTGLALALASTLALTYEPRPFPWIFKLIAHLPFLQAVRTERARALSGFLLALLGALGLDELLERRRERAARRTLVVLVAVGAVVLAYLFADSIDEGLTGVLRHQRLESFWWPGLTLVALAAVALWWRRLGVRARRERVLGVLVVGELAALFFAGVGIPSYSRPFYGVTPAIAEVQRLVGSSLLGLDNGNTGGAHGVRTFGGPYLPEGPAGWYPNVNLGYSVALFGVHDPMVPAAYYATWPVAGAAKVENGVGLFVPAITTAALARRYGIARVLVAAGVAAPSGMELLATIAGERLYAVPGAARFSLLGPGELRELSDNGDGAYLLASDARTSVRAVLRVTALPGWHLSVDGRPVALSTYEGVMESALLPAGDHRVLLTYLPSGLVAGEALALGALVVLVAGALAAQRRGRRTRRGAS